MGRVLTDGKRWISPDSLSASRAPLLPKPMTMMDGRYFFCNSLAKSSGSQGRFSSLKKIISAAAKKSRLYSSSISEIVWTSVAIGIWLRRAVSKKGRFKVGLERGWVDKGLNGERHVTVSSTDPNYNYTEDCLVEVFRDGELLVEYTFDEIRERSNQKYR